MSVRLNPNNALDFAGKVDRRHAALRQAQDSSTQYSSNISFNGGILDSVKKFSDKFVEKESVHKLLRNDFFNKFIRTSSNNPGIYESLIALGITCSIRPLTILTVPGAKKEDKQYAAAQSISSGAVGLGFAYMAYKPIETALDAILKDINSANVDKAIDLFYKDAKNSDLIKQLVDSKIIPSLDEITEILAKNKKESLFGIVKSFAKNNAEENLVKLMLKDENNTTGLLKGLNKALDSAFASIKENNIPETAKYLIHKTIHYGDNGEFKLVMSEAANKTKNFLNQSSKFVLAPILALVTIATIPKVMKWFFPNRNKKDNNKNMLTHEKNIIFAEKMKNTAKAAPVFSSFTNNQPAKAQVSFRGGLEILGKAYDKAYNKPVSGFFKFIFDKIARSKFFSSKMVALDKNATIKKNGLEILKRRADGSIVKKFDNNFFLNNLPQIISCWISGFYVFNTIRNKKIEKERKPALCTNMTVVMLFSLFASKALEKLLKPLLDALQRTHKTLMHGKITYDLPFGWKMAYQLLICTFAFRYLGPVLATPAADKITKFLQKHDLIQKPNETEQTKK